MTTAVAGSNAPQGLRPRRKGLVIGSIAVGVSVAVVASIGIAGRATGGGVGAAATDGLVDDLASEPAREWTYQWSGSQKHVEPNYSVTSDEAVLVWPTLDNEATASEQDSADGQAPAADQPVAPEYTQELALVDLDSGQELWKSTLGDTITTDSRVTVTPFPESDNILVTYIAAPTEDDSASDTSVAVVLNATNGATISTTEFAGSASISEHEGDAIVGVLDDAGYTVSRRQLPALDGQSLWTATIPAEERGYGTQHGDYLVVNADEGGSVLHLADGTTAGWADAVSENTGFGMFEEEIASWTTNDNSTVLDGIDSDGKSRWDSPVTTEKHFKTDEFLTGADNMGSDTGPLFTADAAGEDSYSRLTQVNPVDGSEIGVVYDGEFNELVGVVGDRIVLKAGKQFIVVDVKNGQEVSTFTGDQSGSPVLGAELIYVRTEPALIAREYDGDSPRWSLDLEDNEAVTQLGKRVALFDDETFTFVGLADK